MLNALLVEEPANSSRCAPWKRSSRTLGAAQLHRVRGREAQAPRRRGRSAPPDSLQTDDAVVRHRPTEAISALLRHGPLCVLPRLRDRFSSDRTPAQARRERVDRLGRAWLSPTANLETMARHRRSGVVTVQ